MFIPVCVYSQAQPESLSSLKDEYFKKRSSFTSSSTKKFSTEEQTELNTYVAKAKELDENSFEYHLMLYVNGNYNTDLKESLFKAYSLNSADKIVIREMLAFYIITANTSKQNEFLSKVSKQYSDSEIKYYTDALDESAGVILTSGQEDFFGFLSAQLISGIGSSKQIFCLDLMKNDSYRQLVSNNCGINDMTFLGNEKNYLKVLLSTSSKKIAVSMTVPQEYLSNISSGVYITGLNYRYGNFDQTSLLKIFWEKIKTKDLTTISLKTSAEKKLYANYLVPLLAYYMIEPQEVLLKTTIIAIADKVGKKTEVNEILNEIDAD